MSNDYRRLLQESMRPGVKESGFRQEQRPGQGNGFELPVSYWLPCTGLEQEECNHGILH